MTRIRPPRPDDVGAIADLTTQLGYPTLPHATAERLEALADDRGIVLVATDDAGRAIGWIQIGLVTTLEAGVHGVIHGLVVGEGHRGERIGEALLGAGEAWAGQAGIDVMLVRSRETRERAHRFYERHGYELTKRSHVFRKRLV